MESQLFLPLRCYLSQNHSILRVGMDLWTSFSSTPCQGRTQSRICRKASMWVLSVSREGNFKTCLSSLFQFSDTLYVKKYVHQKKKISSPFFFSSFKHPCLNFTNTFIILCIIICVYVSYLHNLKK